MKEGYKKTEVGEIPAEWQVKRLKDIVSEKRKITYGIVQPGEFDENGTYLIKAGDYSFGWGQLETFFKVGSRIENKYIRSRVKENDILYTIVGSVGNVALVPKNLEGANITQQTARICINELMGNNKFYYYLVQSKMFRKQTGAFLKTGVQPSINLGDLERFKILSPPLKDQEKIADILCTVDCQIDDTDKLIEKCKVLKKGLMQKLLTKGIGHKEFKMSAVGEIPIEWEVKNIGDIAEIVTKGTTPSTIGYNFKYRGINFIRAENINTFGNFEGEYLKISEECNEKLQRSKIYENDILVSIVGYYLGKAAIVTKCEAPANTNQNLAIVRICDNRYSNKYIKIIFDSSYLKKYINRNLTVGAQPSLSLEQIKKFSIPIPQIEEQERIAQIMSTADNEIEYYENKKKKLKTLKKGLMQQLLTGKIRMKI